MRAKRAAYISATSFLHTIVYTIASLILPRLILLHFGSDYNGVVGAINQFIGFTSLITAGVGGATLAALFKPLADSDMNKISGIVRATQGFMRRVALIFAGILVLIAALFPLFVADEFDWFFVFTLTIILGSGSFLQYFFGISYAFLITADQRAYITTCVAISAVILNTIVASLLIINGFEIRIVYLASALVFAINPVFIYIYARRRYRLDFTNPPDNSAIRQRWNAFVHQIGELANGTVPILIITVFAGVFEVSVFVVFFMVVNAIMALTSIFAGSSMTSGFGDMLAKGENETLKDGVRIYEFTCNTLAVLLLSCSVVLIIPFVTVYTAGVYDVSYYRPLFALLICIATFFNIARVPYVTIVNIAGRFKETQVPVLIETGLCVILSVVLVQFVGIAGVAMALIISRMFRTVVFAFYVSRHLVIRSFWVFMRRMLVSGLTAVVIVAICHALPLEMTSVSYFAWVLYALPVFAVALCVSAVSVLIFYRGEAKMLWGILSGLLRSWHRLRLSKY